VSGGLDINIDVSRHCADAVRDRLISEYGIGYLAPRASVFTLEGNAVNRRVEVVLLLGSQKDRGGGLPREST